jgi:transmembrane sensor
VLQGEAFFSVSKNYKKPFIVVTARTQTRVLGTRFNLRDYQSDESGSVTVEEGLVSFSSLKAPSERILLGADEHGELSQGQLKKNNVRATDFSSWRENTLRFDDIPLSQAVPILERRYNIDIQIKNSETGRLRIKATFKEIPVEKIMEELAYLLNIRYRIENKHVNIY